MEEGAEQRQRVGWRDTKKVGSATKVGEAIGLDRHTDAGSPSYSGPGRTDAAGSDPDPGRNPGSKLKPTMTATRGFFLHIHTHFYTYTHPRMSGVSYRHQTSLFERSQWGTGAGNHVGRGNQIFDL